MCENVHVIDDCYEIDVSIHKYFDMLHGIDVQTS